jgi:hypothetical protein
MSENKPEVSEDFDKDFYCLLDKHFGKNHQFEYEWEDQEDGFCLQLWVWSKQIKEKI